MLNYVFILFTFNLYCLVNFNSLATILAVVTDNTIYSDMTWIYITTLYHGSSSLHHYLSCKICHALPSTASARPI